MAKKIVKKKKTNIVEKSKVSLKSKILNKFGSRTFWFGIVGAVAPVIFQGISGKVGWPVTVGASVSAIIAYIVGEKILDGKKVSTLPELLSVLERSDPYGPIAVKIRTLLGIE